MHFWIDKRSSQLHNYGAGRGRPPGSGGFYSRTFGTRHHPPPLLRSSSSSSSSSNANPLPSHNNNHHNPPHYTQTQSNPTSATTSASTTRLHNYNNANSSQITSSSTNNPIPTSTMTTTTAISRELPGGGSEVTSHNGSGGGPAPRFHIPLNRFRFQNAHNPLHHLSQQQQNNQHHQTLHHQPQSSMVGQPQQSFNFNHSNGNGNGNAAEGEGGGGGDNNSNTSGGFLMRNYLGGPFPPVTGVSFQGPGISGGFFGPPSRRPRSQSQAVGIPGRRRSSSGSTTNPNARRASMNRWTYDPYHVHQARQLVNNRQQPMGHPTDPRGEWITSSPASPETGLSTPLNLPDLHTSGVRSNNAAELSTSSGGTSSTHSSMVDPAWRRTKRIGLTLCFMAFILLSTVAAKFVIEGPWLIDKQPRSERAEATIYFFLTELIFVAFAMALFFTGVTCLRKRTNAYLLRQFNQYILQSSPHGAGAMGSPDYFNGHTHHPNNTGGSSSHSQTIHHAHQHSNIMSMSNTGGNNNIGINAHPGLSAFHPHHHYLPSLENHLMMNLSGVESSSFGVPGGGTSHGGHAMGGSGGSKPPPYHIALYLPVPDEQNSGGQVKDQEDKLLPGQHYHPHENPSWIGASEDSNNYGVGGGKTEEDSDVELDEEGEQGMPQRKRQKKDDRSRSETPPPPYGQI